MAVVGPVIARMRARAPREVAWNYLADGALRASWWPDAELEAVFGGAVAERWTAENGESVSRNAVGAIDVLIEGHALGFRWRDGADEHETAVLITFRSQGDETDIMVTETGFGVFPDAFERTADAQQSWIDLLTDYAAALRDVAPVEAEVAEVVESAEVGDAVEVSDAAAEVAEVAGEAEAGEATALDDAEAAEIDHADDEAEVAETDEPGDEAEGGEASDAEPTDDVESDELSDLEELFEADETSDTETSEPSNGDAQQTDEDPEEETPDFDSLIRGDVGDKA